MRYTFYGVGIRHGERYTKYVRIMLNVNALVPAGITHLSGQVMTITIKYDSTLLTAGSI